MYKIMVLEDEVELGKNLKFILESEGYEVTWFQRGDEAVEAALNGSFNLMILDINLKSLPGQLVRYTSGIEVARVIQQSKKIPYVFLTSRVDSSDIMQGLDSGAEDYIGKPYDVGELLARIRRILKRVEEKQDSTSPVIQVGDVELDTTARVAKVEDKKIELSKNLFDLLLLLMKNKGAVLSQEEISREVWGYDDTYDTNHIAVNIRRLRSIIGQDYIHTKRGVGYVFDEPV